jgi:2-methylcitrate dehydratase PrpD
MTLLSESPTLELCRFLSGLEAGDFPEAARDAARSALLDVLACAVGGVSERVAVATRRWV